MKLDGQTGIVILNMGGPDSLDDVEPFLTAIFADPLMIRLPWFLKPFQARLGRRVARRRAPDVVRNYERMGGRSPILEITGAQADGVAARLGCEGYVAMRYTAPRADETVRLMLAEGIRRAVAVSGYPQHSLSTSTSSVEDFRRAWRAAGCRDEDLLTIERWSDDSGYIQAVAATVREAVDLLPDSRNAHVLFSAHGLPARYVRDGDTYERDIRRTLDLVLKAAGVDLPHTLAFQSRVGPIEWLRPYTDDAVRRLGREGVRRLVMVPLGFISDHVETIYELDMLYGGLAREFGMITYRAPSLNDRGDFLDALAALVRGRVKAARTTDKVAGPST